MIDKKRKEKLPKDYPGGWAAGKIMDFLTQGITLIAKFATMGGALWTLWGLIILAGGLKDKNGPALQSGIWQMVGGGLIVAAAALFSSITTA